MTAPSPPGGSIDAEHWHPAPAKLNLMLHVVGRRPDGYHELQTVFRFLDHGDRLAFRSRRDGAVTRVNPIDGLDPEADLCVRAALALRQAAQVPEGVEITLDKRLPMGAGLGGGSSDAATTLIVLNRLWRIDWPGERLRELGLALGADVPVFLFGRAAFAEGVGERLAPIALPDAWYVVLTPAVSVPTARIFSHPELTRNSNRMKIPAFFPGVGRNDLEPAAVSLYPEIGRHLAWLSRHGEARMTGSGSAVFAPFADEAAARSVFDARLPDMHGFVARGLIDHPLAHLILGSRQAG